MDYAVPPGEPVCLPVSGSQQFFPIHRVYCVGRNFAEHAQEMGGCPDREPPFFFSKPADAIVSAPALPYPTMTANLHHEVELVVALGEGGTQVSVESALALVIGYAVGVDLTRRDLQAVAKKQGRPWDIAKGFDRSGPVSAIVPARICGHPDSGLVTLAVNGVERQRGDLAQMIWSVAEVIVELSRYYELQAGDLIFTGTPAGVAALEPGDRVSCSIEGVGKMKFSIEAE